MNFAGEGCSEHYADDREPPLVYAKLDGSFVAPPRSSSREGRPFSPGSSPIKTVSDDVDLSEALQPIHSSLDQLSKRVEHLQEVSRKQMSNILSKVIPQVGELQTAVDAIWAELRSREDSAGRMASLESKLKWIEGADASYLWDFPMVRVKAADCEVTLSTPDPEPEVSDVNEVSTMRSRLDSLQKDVGEMRKQLVPSSGREPSQRPPVNLANKILVDQKIVEKLKQDMTSFGDVVYGIGVISGELLTHDHALWKRVEVMEAQMSRLCNFTGCEENSRLHSSAGVALDVESAEEGERIASELNASGDPQIPPVEDEIATLSKYLETLRSGISATVAPEVVASSPPSTSSAHQGLMDTDMRYRDANLKRIFEKYASRKVSVEASTSHLAERMESLRQQRLHGSIVVPKPQVPVASPNVGVRANSPLRENVPILASAASLQARLQLQKREVTPQSSLAAPVASVRAFSPHHEAIVHPVAVASGVMRVHSPNQEVVAQKAVASHVRMRMSSPQREGLMKHGQQVPSRICLTEDKGNEHLRNLDSTTTSYVVTPAQSRSSSAECNVQRGVVSSEHGSMLLPPRVMLASPVATASGQHRHTLPSPSSLPRIGSPIRSPMTTPALVPVADGRNRRSLQSHAYQAQSLCPSSPVQGNYTVARSGREMH
jgi:hypothetical protein